MSRLFNQRSVYLVRSASTRSYATKSVDQQIKEFLARPDIAPTAAKFGITYKEPTAEENQRSLNEIKAQLQQGEKDAVKTFVASLDPEKPFF
ncbi:hypothetical protein PPL_10823 [Heterostelium album PN500]|uniref:Uncharacterized protein n=1 Tax=Heterostelium pallidum (strain ATCC 26659 / Pp 5 / PN500) TaxID=670386 RepID=D3BS31_HETP5|nr:hypothetical protein PPL_10823 [Heterostelium album PN500]EFA75768.1 hypothetical protein PPL_10823 [Heterostelium album PN500]|eukprot:XP_020427902.1 hypothetical protein PPL_10823 [Heterostelium album PN500]